MKEQENNKESRGVSILSFQDRLPSKSFLLPVYLPQIMLANQEIGSGEAKCGGHKILML